MGCLIGRCRAGRGRSLVHYIREMCTLQHDRRGCDLVLMMLSMTLNYFLLSGTSVMSEKSPKAQNVRGS